MVFPVSPASQCLSCTSRCDCFQKKIYRPPGSGQICASLKFVQRRKEKEVKTYSVSLFEFILVEVRCIWDNYRNYLNLSNGLLTLLFVLLVTSYGGQDWIPVQLSTRPSLPCTTPHLPISWLLIWIYRTISSEKEFPHLSHGPPRTNVLVALLRSHLEKIWSHLSLLAMG